MERPKILVLTPELGSGGAQKVFKDQLAFYQQHYHVTGCIFNWGGALAEEKSMNVVSLDVPGGKNLITKLYFFFLRVHRLRRLKKKLSVDVAISHLEGADYVNIFSKKAEKTVTYIHGTKIHDGDIAGLLGFFRKKILMPFAYKKADVIITVSKGIYDEFVSVLKIPPEKVHVVTNGFDLKKISADALVAIPSDVEVIFKNFATICLCSRLARQKNQEVFLLVFSHLISKTPAKLIILGDGDLRSLLIEKAASLGLRVYNAWSGLPVTADYDVYFLGIKSNPFSFVSKTTVFALPSAWEGFPLALCEAMACGVPVIASDCPTGPAQILNDGASENAFGFLLPIPTNQKESTLAEWSNTLSRVITDRSLANEYGQRACSRMKDFGSEKMEDEWIRLIELNTGLST